MLSAQPAAASIEPADGPAPGQTQDWRLRTVSTPSDPRACVCGEVGCQSVWCSWFVMLFRPRLEGRALSREENPANPRPRLPLHFGGDLAGQPPSGAFGPADPMTGSGLDPHPWVRVSA